MSYEEISAKMDTNTTLYALMMLCLVGFLAFLFLFVLNNLKTAEGDNPTAPNVKTVSESR